MRGTPEYFIKGVVEEVNRIIASDDKVLQAILEYIQTKFKDTSADTIFTEYSKNELLHIIEKLSNKYPADIFSEFRLSSLVKQKQLETKSEKDLVNIFEKIVGYLAAVRNDPMVRALIERQTKYFLTFEGAKKLLLTRKYIIAYRF